MRLMNKLLFCFILSLSHSYVFSGELIESNASRTVSVHELSNFGVNVRIAESAGIVMLIFEKVVDTSPSETLVLSIRILDQPVTQNNIGVNGIQKYMFSGDLSERGQQTHFSFDKNEYSYVEMSFNYKGSKDNYSEYLYLSTREFIELVENDDVSVLNDLWKIGVSVLGQR